MATTTEGARGLRPSPPAAARLRVEPPGRGRRPVRVPWIVLGVLIIAGCALTAAVWAGRVAQRSPVLVLARPVEHGQLLAVEDLSTVSVAVDGQVALIPAAAAEELVGRAAAGALPAGTLLTEQMVTSDPGLAVDDRVVGLALDPGEYPTSVLRPGDEVMVLRTPPPATGGGEELGAAAVLVPRATVYAVQPLDEASTSVLVSVLVDESSAAPIAAAASQDRVRLVLAGSGS